MNNLPFELIEIICGKIEEKIFINVCYDFCDNSRNSILFEIRKYQLKLYCKKENYFQLIHYRDYNGLKYLISIKVNIQIFLEQALVIGIFAFPVIKFLIDQGADIVPYKRSSLLMSIIIWGEVEMVKYLIEKGMDIKIGNNWPVRLAAKKGNLKMVEYLVSQGADITAKNNYALRKAVKYGKHEMVDYLIENGADINCIENDKDRYFHNMLYKMFRKTPNL
jgi:ankyrin repeat protein